MADRCTVCQGGYVRHQMDCPVAGTDYPSRGRLLDALAAAEAERDALAARLSAEQAACWTYAADVTALAVRLNAVEALAAEWEVADEGYTGEAAYFAHKHAEMLRDALAGDS